MNSSQQLQTLTQIIYQSASCSEGRAVYSAWAESFEALHGKLERKRTVDRLKLAKVCGIEGEGVDLLRLVFALEAMYSLQLVAVALGALHKIRGQEAASAANRDPVQRVCEAASPNFFKSHGIENLNDFEWLAWLSRNELIVGTSSFRSACAEFFDRAEALSTTGRADPLRALYQQLIPKQVRHALGSHYTPEWLAEYLTETLCGADSKTAQRLPRFIDPTCGSGTFLLAACRHNIKQGRRMGLSADEIVNSLQSDIVGIDVNPMAVASAKTNLLCLLAELWSGCSDKNRNILLPVACADSICREVAAPNPTLLDLPGAHRFRFRGRTIRLFLKTHTRKDWERFAEAFCLEAAKGTPFVSVPEKLGGILLPGRESREGAEQLYSILRAELQYTDRELVAQRLTEARTPEFVGEFDFALGNPPWVNWEYLPPEYRRDIADLWPKMGLFDLKGREQAFSKEDVSALVTYATCSFYLRSGGKLAFLVPQSLFKSALNARGFRKFTLHDTSEPLCVFQVDDLVSVNPFDGAVNRTAAVFIERNKSTSYPVDYLRWELRGPRAAISDSSHWENVRDCFALQKERAFQADPSVFGSHWATSAGGEEMFEKLAGENPYRARTGMFTGGLNAAFYVTVARVCEGGVIVANVTERAKKPLPKVDACVEADLLYPLLRGRDVSRWHVNPSMYVLCAHTRETRMEALPPETLAAKYPKALSYFERFRSELSTRKGFLGWEKQYLERAFYALQRLGDYSFAPYKVVWRYIAREFTVAVAGPASVPGAGVKPTIPNEKLMLIGCDDEAEAYFVCGLLTSAPIRAYVEARMVETQIAPHVIQRAGLPKFDPSSKLHVELGEACRSGHEAIASGRSPDEAAARVDNLASSLLNVSSNELAAFQEMVNSRSRRL